MNTNLEIDAECYPCIMQQVASLSKLVNLDEEQTKELFNTIMEKLINTNGKGLVVQHIVREATDKVISLLKKRSYFDPYETIKKESNDLVIKYSKEIENQVVISSEPIKTAVKMAAAGNIIDFGAKNHASLNVEKEIERISEQEFGVFDYEDFYEKIFSAKRLLYICDNAGEIVFDKILIKEILKEFSGIDITCAVREKPIINDAVLIDAKYTSLDKIVRVISSGSIYPGTLLDETSEEFKKYYQESDVIISKGQGNFETLLDIADERVFFILRIKCEKMASLSNVSQGALVLMQGRN